MIKAFLLVALCVAVCMAVVVFSVAKLNAIFSRMEERTRLAQLEDERRRAEWKKFCSEMAKEESK